MREGYGLPGAEIWIAPSPKCWSGAKRKRWNDAKERKRKKAKPLEVELDLSGGYSRGNMSMSSLENGKGRIWSFLAI